MNAGKQIMNKSVLQRSSYKSHHPKNSVNRNPKPQAILEIAIDIARCPAGDISAIYVADNGKDIPSAIECKNRNIIKYIIEGAKQDKNPNNK